jgi:fibronectin type 3 domain-containing protein
MAGRKITVVSTLAIALAAVVGVTIYLTGSKSAQHAVTLTWKAPELVKGIPIQGYNIYRSVTRSGPYALVASRVPSTTYSDSIVNSGKTYFYVVTAVDQSGSESKYSEEVSVHIP